MRYDGCGMCFESAAQGAAGLLYQYTGCSRPVLLVSPRAFAEFAKAEPTLIVQGEAVRAVVGICVPFERGTLTIAPDERLKDSVGRMCDPFTLESVRVTFDDGGAT